MKRIYFELDPHDWHGGGFEGLWAEPIEDSTPGVYRLLNSPFYARGVSYLDIVRAVPRPDGRGWRLQELSIMAVIRHT